MDFANLAKKNKILEIRIGSHLFGTDTPESDLDLYGLFMPFDEILFGFHRCEDVKFDKVDKDESGRNTKDAIDFTLTEYRKFIKLAIQNNPNILHILFADDKNILFKNEFGERLLEKAYLFPHKGAHHRFVKYAESQLHKMRIKPEKYKDLQQGLTILENSLDYAVMSDVLRSCEGLAESPFKDEGKGKLVKCGDISLERGVFVKKARRMISKRLDKFTSRASMYSKHGYDLKYASNLIQLLKEGIELMETGKIVFPLSYRQDILDIKSGKYKAEEIVEWSEELIEDARRAYEASELPVKPRTKEIEYFATQEVKRWVLDK